MKPKKWLCIIILFILIIFKTLSNPIYVSPTGNDSASGTSSGSPLKTLSEARDRVQDIIGGMTNDIIVLFSPGTYYNNAPVEFTDEDSGINGHRIIYKSNATDENDKVYIVGGREITGWSSSVSGVHTATVSLAAADTYDLYENRRKGTEVDNPAGLPLSEILTQVNSKGEYYYDEAQSKLYYYPRNPVISAREIFIAQAENIIDLRGASDTSPIENISFVDLVIMGSKIGGSDFSLLGDESGLIYMENARSITIDSCELLNAGVSGIVVNKYAQDIHLLNNRIDNFNHHGISLRGYILGSGGYTSPGNADVNKQNNIENNFIVNGGYKSDSGSGIRIYQSGDNTITNNRIRNIQGNGIMIHGPDDEIVNGTYWNTNVTAGNKWDFIHARHNSITENDISRITPRTIGGGIYLAHIGDGNGDETTIENNCIHDFYLSSTGAKPSGIYIDRLSILIIVRENIIHTINTKSSTGRPMFISGNDCTIEYNIFSGYGAQSGMGFKSTSNTAQDLWIQDNIFYRDKGRYIYDFEEFESDNFNDCNENFFYHPDGEYQVKTPNSTYPFNSWKQQGSSGYDVASDTGEDPLFEEAESHYYKLKNGTSAPKININQTNIGLYSSFSHYYARDVIEAEKCISPSGITDRVTTIRSSLTGTYARYPNIYFEDTLTNIEIKYSCDAPSGTSTSRGIEIHLDSTSGLLLHSFNISGTGGLADYNVKRAHFTTPPGISGVHDVFLVFRGSSPAIQLDWFHFYDVSAEPVLPTNIPPEVSFISPLNGAKPYYEDDINISVTAVDPDGKIESITLSGNGGEMYSTNGSTLNYTWSNANIGTHILKAVALDNDGDSGEASITIYVTDVPNNPPIVEIFLSEPEKDGKYQSGENITITVEAQDNDGSIDRVELDVNDQRFSALNNVPYIRIWTPPYPGTYTIKAAAIDDRGARGEAKIEADVFISPSNIIGHWPLDSLGGGIVQDVSIHENHGTAINVTTTSGIKDGSACYFDGTAYIDMNKSLMNDLPQFTFAGWIKPEKLVNGSKVGFWGQREVVTLGFSTENTLEVFTIGKGGISTAYKKDLNEWHHLAVIGDGKGLALYLDGILLSGKTNDSVSNYGSRPFPFKIGGGGLFDNSGNYFTGAIDDVWLYDCAISKTELLTLASKGENIRPYVRITQPEDGAIFDAPAEILIKVDASDKDGNIDLIELYTQESHIGTIFGKPYEYLWTGVPPGNYVLSAMAIDNEGVESTHSIMISVTTDSKNILASWSLNEGAGLIAHENSGYKEYDGEIISADWAVGISGSCLFFDGKGIVRSAKELLNGRRSFTVSYWMKPTKIKKMMGILGQNAALINSFNHDNLLAVWTSGNVDTSVPAIVPLNVWSHIALVGTGKQLLIYINGEVTGRTEKETDNYFLSSQRFEFGGISVYGNPGNYYQGYLDEIFIYEGDLREDEIKMLAKPPELAYPSMRIVSPKDLSQYIVGESVTIQAEVVNVGLTGIILELYIDGGLKTTLKDPYTIEWTFSDSGTYTINLKAQSDRGMWAEESVSITVLTEEEAEALEEDEDALTSDPDEEMDPDEWKEEDPYDEDESGDEDSSKYMHASKDEIVTDLEHEIEKTGETFVEYVERITREIEVQEMNEKIKAEEGSETEFVLTDNNGENGDSGEGSGNNTDYISNENNTSNKDNGNNLVNGDNGNTNVESGNVWTWMFGNTDNELGNGKNKPTLGFILIILLLISVVAISCFIIIKKIYSNKKPKYYYD